MPVPGYRWDRANDRVEPCPHCGRQPQIERVEPWPSGHGPAPWYVGCYSQSPTEHVIGGSADTRAEAVKAWRDAVIRETA